MAIILMVFMSNSQVDEQALKSEEAHNGKNPNEISLSQFKKETTLVNVENYLKIVPAKSKMSRETTRLSDFIIDTLAIKKLTSSNDKISYTFRIYPLNQQPEKNEFYNLVYRKVNNSWETSIFYLKKFPKNPINQKIFEKIERIYESTTKASQAAKTTNLEMCSFETTVVNCNGSCKAEGEATCDGFACEFGWCTQTSITYQSCDSGGGGGGASSDPSGTIGGGGAAADPYAYSPYYYDNPVFDDPNYINAVKRSYA